MLPRPLLHEVSKSHSAKLLALPERTLWVGAVSKCLRGGFHCYHHYDFQCYYPVELMELGLWQLEISVSLSGKGLIV